MESLDLRQEMTFKTARSGGKGGQNVNKLETMVQARWNIRFSKLVDEEQKETLRQTLAHRINKEEEIIVTSSEHRTQIENKERAVAKLNHLIQKALVKRAPRRKTKIPKAVVEKRLSNKKLLSEKKQNRRKWD